MGSMQANVTLGSSSRLWQTTHSDCAIITTIPGPNPGSHRKITLSWKISQEKTTKHTFLQVGN